MATFELSPRRHRTAEEKRAEDEKYRVTVKNFGEILKGLVQIFNALVLLNQALGQAGKGAYLAFPNPQVAGQMIPFNRKHVRSANAKFARQILQLKNYLRVSKKKTREPGRPESFSGVYAPVYAGPALVQFFTAAPEKFGPLHPLEAAITQVAGEALMTQLRYVSEGYLLRNTITMLFYIYAHNNNLQDPQNAQFARSDDVMTAAFGGEVPATFYVYRGNDGKKVKIPMEQAVSEGLVTAPMNTYQVVQLSHPDFNPARFNTYHYQGIASVNYYSKDVLANQPALVDALQRGDVRAAMLQEHTIVKGVSAEWHELLEPGRKVQREARKKQQDLAKKAAKAAAGQ